MWPQFTLGCFGCYLGTYLAAYAACTILNGDVKGCFEECNNIVFTKGCIFANIDRGVRYRIIFEIIGTALHSALLCIQRFRRRCS